MAGYKSSLDAISSKKWGPILGIVIASVIAFILLAYISPSICFGFLICVLVIYFIPYYFGLKSFKLLAVWGIAFILLMPIPLSYFSENVVYEYEDKDIFSESKDKTIINGTVTPYIESENGTYTFTVEADEKYDVVKLWIAPTSAFGIYFVGNGHSSSYSMTTEVKTEDGKNIWSVTLDNLSPNMYSYMFEGKLVNESSEIDGEFTSAVIGPINEDSTSLYVTIYKTTVTNVALYIGLLYFLLMFMMYTNRRNRELFEQQRAKQSRPEEGPDGTFHCPKCNSEVIKGQKFCPQCGESFAVDPKEVQMPSAPFKGADDDYFCTECGTKVDENATVCPGCGKKFE